MKINRENARADGLTDEEIAFIEAYLDNHGIDDTAALVRLGKQLRLVIRTVAEALDQLRPGCWLDRRSDEHPEE